MSLFFFSYLFCLPKPSVFSLAFKEVSRLQEGFFFNTMFWRNYLGNLLSPGVRGEDNVTRFFYGSNKATGKESEFNNRIILNSPRISGFVLFSYFPLLLFSLLLCSAILGFKFLCSGCPEWALSYRRGTLVTSNKLQILFGLPTENWSYFLSFFPQHHAYPRQQGLKEKKIFTVKLNKVYKAPRRSKDDSHINRNSVCNIL